MIQDILMLSDTHLQDTTPTTNYESEQQLAIGASNFSPFEITRGIFKPDFPPAIQSLDIVSATLHINRSLDRTTNVRTMYAHRILKTVNMVQATWNEYATGSAWGSGGASSSGVDYDSTVLGSVSIPSSGTGWTYLSLDVDEIKKFIDGTYANNGILLFVGTQSSDMWKYSSKESASTLLRPKLVIEYQTTTSAAFAAMLNNRRPL